MKDSIFTNSGEVGKLRLTGLEPGLSYQLRFFASRVAPDARLAKYIVGSKSAVLNAALNGGNVSATAVIPVVASPGGEIDIAVTNETGSAFGYLGAF